MFLTIKAELINKELHLTNREGNMRIIYSINDIPSSLSLLMLDRTIAFFLIELNKNGTLAKVIREVNGKSTWNKARFKK